MKAGKYWTLDGHEAVPTDIHTWSRMFDADDGAARLVGATDIGESHISTVFLGMDHQWGDGPPLLFETMVFRGPHDQSTWRYTTWDQAEAGHARVVAAIEGGHDPDESA